jgi:hypothetical protein
VSGEKKWHKGSRYWKVAREAVWIAGLLAGSAVAFRPGSVEAAFGMFGGIVGVALAGAAWTNGKERSAEFQTAVALREEKAAARVEAGPA